MAATDGIRGRGPTVYRRAVLGTAMVVLLVASLFGLRQASTARTGLIEDATASGRALVDATLVPELTSADASDPASGDRYERLAEVTRRGILSAGTVSAVTIWGADATILFATDLGLVGNQVRSMRPTVLSAIGDEPGSDVDRGLLRTFVPVRLGPGVSVLVELDADADPVASATDPWRLFSLLAGAGAALTALLLGRSFLRARRPAEGFDEEALRAAVAERRRAERDREQANARTTGLEKEVERLRAALREAEEATREASREAEDAVRLREHLALAAEDVQRAEQDRDALKERLAAAGREAETEAARGRDEVAAALAEVARLEGVRQTLQERAAKAEAAVGDLEARIEELNSHPDVEAELRFTHQEVAAARRDLAGAVERAERAERRNAELEETAQDLTARLRDLERRPDLSAKVDAASDALDIARDQIRALTARADASDAEAQELRAALEQATASRTSALEKAKALFLQLRADLEAANAELRTTSEENAVLREEMRALRHEADAAGQMLANAKAELLQMAEHATSLKARAEAAESALGRQSETLAVLEAERTTAASDAEAARGEAGLLRSDLERTRAELRAAREAAAQETAEANERTARAEAALGEIEAQLQRARLPHVEVPDRTPPTPPTVADPGRPARVRSSLRERLGREA